MQHKHFFGTSVQDAMQRACYKLGDEIVLLDSKPLAVAGNTTNKLNLVQITVGLPESANPKKKRNEISSSDNSRGKASDFSELLEQYSDGLYSSDINRKKRNQLREDIKKSQFQPDVNIDEIAALLKTAGVSAEHAEVIINHITEDLKNQTSPTDIMELLEAKIADLFDTEWPENFTKVESQRIIAFVGPTGVGKTSVIMKMAASRKFFKGKKVAIISTDNYRIAGSESLRLFSNLLGIPFKELKNPDDLETEIESLKDYEVILIDTPGRSPLFPNFYSELQDYFSISRTIEKIVVLSATADLEDIYLSSALFTLLNPNGLIVTKLDETARAGKLVSIQMGIGIPVLAISDGQSIPLDMKLVSGKNVWEKMVQSF